MHARLWRHLAVATALALPVLGPLQAQAGRPAVVGQTLIQPTATPGGAAATPTATPAAQPAAAGGVTAATASAPAAPALAPQGHATATTVPVGFDKTSENDALALYVEKASGQIAVEDKRTHLIWLSNPRRGGPQTGPAPSVSSQQETAAVYFMNYTDYQRQVVKLLNSAWDPTPPVVSALPDGGTRVTFTPKQQLQSGPISFAMDYHLHDGYFDVTIPKVQIKETINDAQATGSYLVTLEPLPFFGAGADDEQGYMLVPDGSGAIVRFKKIHPDYLQPFNQEVYAPDVGAADSFSNNTIGTTPSQEPVMLPAFGIAKQADESGKPVNGAFMGLALRNQGDADVFMDVQPSGYITRYNHAGAQFLYRRSAQIPRSRGVMVTRVATPLVGGDKTMRYYLLGGQDATYAGMAAKYRDYLQHELNIPTLKAADAPLNLDLTMGAQRKGLISYELVPATTFAEAEQIIDALRQRGVNRIQVTLRGWNRDGMFKASPNRMPPDARLGGTDGLTHLTAFAKRLGVKVELLDDYVRALSGEKGFFAHNDAMRGANKLPAFSNGVGQGQFLYLLNPIVEYNQFALRDVPKEKLMGAAGDDLLGFGAILSYDTNEAHPLGRDGYIDWNMKIVDYVKGELGDVSVEGGNAYILGHVQDARHVSVDDSHWQFEDEAVPFYQLVMHGFLTYTGKNANLRSDPQFEFLRELEYGAVPSFDLTYLPTSDLNRAYVTYQNWSSGWTEWLDDLVREYQDVSVQLGPTTNQFIVDHHKLADNVSQTTYADGTKVIVNYSSQRYTNGALAVDALNYAITH